MNMLYVLVLVIKFSGHPATTLTAEFGTLAACKQAQVDLRRQLGPNVAASGCYPTLVAPE